MPFPQSPGVGDEYTTEDTVWRYNGANWDRIRIGYQNKTDYANTNLIYHLAVRINELEALLDKHLLVID